MGPVQLEVFSDVACPWCREAHEQLLAALGQEEPGSVEVVHRAFELRPGTTRDAHRLVKVAAHFGRADETVHALLVAPDADPVEVVAGAAGFDATSLRAALQEGIGDPEVQADLDRAGQLGIRAVPYFVADGRLALSGAQGTDALRRLLAAARERRGETRYEAAPTRSSRPAASSSDR